MGTTTRFDLAYLIIPKTISCFSQQKSSSELANVRIVFRKDGIAGKGTFGIVQRVKILNISEIDPCANDVKKGTFMNVFITWNII